MSQRILIIGSGFAGLWSALAAARLLDQAGRTDIQVTLVSPQPELHIRPRLYEPNPASMTAPLAEVFAAAGVTFIAGWVQRIDVQTQTVSVAGGHREGASERTQQVLRYDRLVLAAGSRLNRPAISGLDAHAFNVDQLNDAARLDAHLQALRDRPASAARNTVVVAGGGFTGIETAAEMPARLRQILGGEVAVNVVIVERSAELGPDLGPGPRPVITQALNELGVTWRLGGAVAEVDANGVRLQDGERIDSATVIWTAGARASALTAQIPAERDAFGRLYVDRNLKVNGQDAVFATGDCAYAATDDDGHHAMMSCQHAMNLGRASGHNAAAELIGQAPIAYRQPRYVTCLDLGPWGAVFTEGWDRQVKMTGAPAKALKTRINTEWIYPPRADRAEIFMLADPQRIVVA